MYELKIFEQFYIGDKEDFAKTGTENDIGISLEQVAILIHCI